MLSTKLAFILFVSFTVVFSLYGQSNADCRYAVEIKHLSTGSAQAPRGIGQEMEILSHKDSPYFFEKEHNTAWYWFEVKQNCVLTLDLIPQQVKDDYDFMLFRYTDQDFCHNVGKQLIRPVRSNLSRNNPSISSKTGLSEESTVFNVARGPGHAYSRALQVNKGDVYYLVVDNVYDNGQGHTIDLHYSKCEEREQVTIDIRMPEKPSVLYVEDEEDKKKKDHGPPARLTAVTVAVTDKEDQPIKADLKVLNPEKGGLVSEDAEIYGVSKCIMYMAPNKTYELRATSEGYFPFTKSIKVSMRKMEVQLKLERYTVGGKVILDEIYFYGNSARILPTSDMSLENLTTFLEDNPNMSIKINGHVNWPKETSTAQEEKFNMDLSTDRAKAVYDYLIKQGIREDRLSYEGFSNSQMLYPNPVTDDQQKMNRRVEVEIISN